MRVKQVFPARLVASAAVAAAVAMFTTGRPVSASEQAAGQQPPAAPTQAPAASAQAPAPGQGEGPEVRMTVADAVRMAVENNMGIQTQRLSPQVQALALARAEGAYAPTLFSNLQRTANTSPPTDFLSIGTATTSTGDFNTDAGVQQSLKWGGGSYSLSMGGRRFTSDALRVVFSPQLSSNINASITQPLLRNFKIDQNRQQVLQARNQMEIADIQLAARITQTARSVRSAYYDLVGAIGALDVARQSLDLSRQSLLQNERRVEVGAMAQIDIVEAQAEVAQREEAVIIAEATIRAAEDNLRTLVMNPSQPDFWAVRLVPTERPSVAPQAVDVEAAIANALKNRTDLLETRKELESTDIDIRYAENQRLPAVNLSARYGLSGTGGTQNVWAGGVDETPVIVRSSQRRFGDVLRDVVSNDFNNWAVTLSVNYPLGTSTADAAVAQGRVQRQQATLSLREQEMAVVSQVREVARQVNTTQQRVEATRKAREFAERRLEAENKRVTVGLATTFQLFQAQRDLDSAKQRELQALIDYNRALVNLEAVQVAPLTGR
jgi:outer membrane protein